MHMLFLGDSITDCGHNFDPAGLGDGYVNQLYQTISASMPDLSVANKGIDGFTTPFVRKMWHSYLKEHPEALPDIVSILVGVNDVGVWMEHIGTPGYLSQAYEYFCMEYEDLITDILDQGVTRIILMEPFIFPHPAVYETWIPHLRYQSDHIRSLADKYHLSFLPLHDMLNEAAGRTGFRSITTDGIHPDTPGHKLIADAWLQLAKSIM